MKKESTIRSFFLVAMILPAAAYVLFSYYERKIQRLPVLGGSELVNHSRVDHTVEDFNLANQDGMVLSKSRWSDKIVVADFFFTHCTSVCPRMTASLKKVSAEFKNDEALMIGSFSVDPERDSVSQLKSYAQQFSLETKNWDLFTGNKKEIYRLARNGFMIVATDGDGGPDDFIHSEKLVLLDRQHRIRGYYDGTSDKEVKQLILDIKKLKHEDW
jgi:protein SCO1